MDAMAMSWDVPQCRAGPNILVRAALFFFAF